MSELYHIKKKNPFKDDDTDSLDDVINKIESKGKKVKSTIAKIQSSSGYQKVQLAQKVKKDKTPKKSFVSGTLSSIQNFGSEINKKATGTAAAAVAMKKINTSNVPYVSDEYQQELAYNSQKNYYPNKINEPKKLRKKLNATKLREIVGPKGGR